MSLPRVTAPITAFAALMLASGCGFTEYSTRTGPLPGCIGSQCADREGEACALLSRLGFTRRESDITPARGSSCFGEWARVGQDTTDVLRLEHTVAGEGRGSDGVLHSRTVIRIAIVALTTVADGANRRHIKASPDVRRDADLVMHGLRDIYLRR